MGRASKDNNRVPTLLGALNTDGKTPIPIQVGATTHGFKISDGTTGSDNGTTNAQRDANRIPVGLGVSSADGKTLIEIYADSSGNLLTKST